MRKGKRLAIDVGTVRFGLAVCDAEGILASPLPVLERSPKVSDSVLALLRVADEQGAFEIYVGEPISLDGSATSSTNDARIIAQELARESIVAVRLIDERFTTVSAASKLRAAGVDSKRARTLIDSASAVEILENALQTERSTRKIPGQLVGDSVGA